MRGDGERTTVIRNGTLIDGTGDDASPNDALVIEGNRIKSIGKMPEGLDDAAIDVIIVSRDPVEDIRVLKDGAHPTTVIKDGKVVDLGKAIGPGMLSFVDDAARRSNVA